MASYEMQGLAVGDRVKIHPATDLFMRGERYGDIVKVGRKWVHIRGERSDRVFKLAPQFVDLAPLTIPRSWTRHGGTDYLTTI